MSWLRLSIISATIAFLATPSLRADVKLHPLFADHMVLQRDARVPIWGTADPGEKVTIRFEVTFGEKSIGHVDYATADDQGVWKTSVATAGASTNASLKVSGKNQIELKNIAIGDVWLCSGQSNMEWKLARLTAEDRGTKAAATAANKNLRLFTVPNRPFKEPQSSFPVSKSEGCWLECTPETVLNFSAVAYFFGRDIEASQKVPIGLIESDWGGTPCAAWSNKESLAAEPSLKFYADAHDAIDEAKAMAAYEKALAAHQEAAAKAKAAGKNEPNPPTKPLNGGVFQSSPSALYNGMIAPLHPFKFKGVIWYQGESNATRAVEYRTLYPAMIKGWREKWGEDFPFFTVQLAPFRGNRGSAGVDYAELRDAQTNACKVLPKVGMAVITDVGDENDIHPQRKEPVGQRLALAARALAYGEKIEASGPVYDAMSINEDKVALTFKHLGGGLVAKGDALHGFTVCGEDKVFHPATATIESDRVIVHSEKVAKPVAVRFGWVNFAKPELNFFNKAGLPAVPFRTDDFPFVTK